MLDLMRTTPRDANYTGLGSRLSVLRPELIAAFCQVYFRGDRSNILPVTSDMFFSCRLDLRIGPKFLFVDKLTP